MPEEALTSFTVSDTYSDISLVRGTGTVIDLRSASRSRTEYLITTNNIKVLDSYFKLTN